MEEIHELDSAPFFESLVVNSLRLVIEFKLDGEDFDLFCSGFNTCGLRLAIEDAHGRISLGLELVEREAANRLHP